MKKKSVIQLIGSLKTGLKESTAVNFSWKNAKLMCYIFSSLNPSTPKLEQTNLLRSECRDLAFILL